MFVRFLVVIALHLFLLRAQKTVLPYISGGQASGFPTGQKALEMTLAEFGRATYSPDGRVVLSIAGRYVGRIEADGVVTAIAGSGFTSPSGNGGPALNAGLSPAEFRYAPDGRLYLTDGTRFHVIDPQGRIQRVGAGEFSVQSMAVTSSGDIVFCDGASGSVRRLGRDGTVSDIVVSPGRDGMVARSIAALPGGDIVFYNAVTFQLVRATGQGVTAVLAGGPVAGFSGDGGPAAQARFRFSGGFPQLAADPSGNIFVTDPGNQRIRRISPEGVVTTVAGSGESGFDLAGGNALAMRFGFLQSLAASSAGRIAFYDSTNRLVWEVDPGTGRAAIAAGNGVRLRNPDTTTIDALVLSSPDGMVFDRQGNLYVADGGAHLIWRVTPAGVATRYAGNGVSGCCGDGGAATEASFNSPAGLAMDAQGSLYVADMFNARIRKIASNGIISTIAGGAGSGFFGEGVLATTARLSTPKAVAVDGAGNVFVADTGNHRVRKISTSGVITTVAGNGLPGFDGFEGIGSSRALLSPSALAVDSSGTLYIADTGNRFLRRLTPGGTLLRFESTAAAPQEDPYPDIRLLAMGRDGSMVANAGGELYTVAPTGARTRIAGTFSSPGSSGDYGPAAQATFGTMQSAAYDAAGNLYVGDGSRIRVIRNVNTTLTLSSSAVRSLPARIDVSTNTPGIPFAVTIAYGGSQQGWLRVDQTANVAPAALLLTAVPGAMAAGRYTANVTVAGAGTIAVTYDAPGAGGVTVSPAIVSGVAPAGAGGSFGTVWLTNEGGTAVGYVATIEGLNGASPVFGVEPAQGTVAAGGQRGLGLGVRAGTTAGIYRATVVIAASGRTTRIPVTAVVEPGVGGISVSTDGLRFRARVGGGSPLVQEVLIGGSGGWQAETSAPWLRLTPSTGKLTVEVEPSGLAAGLYSARVLFRQGEVAARAVTVTLDVVNGVLPVEVSPTALFFGGLQSDPPGSQTVRVGNPNPGAQLLAASNIGSYAQAFPMGGRVSANGRLDIAVQGVASYPGNPDSVRTEFLIGPADGARQAVQVVSRIVPDGCMSTKVHLAFASVRNDFSARTGEALPVTVLGMDDCGSFLDATRAPGGPVVLASSGDGAIGLRYFGNGEWRGSWKPVTAGAVVRLTAWFGSEATSVSGTVTESAFPIVSAASIVHAASVEAGVPLSPGGLVTIYGRNLSGAGEATEVWLGDKRLPQLFTSASQVNAQVPLEVPVGMLLPLSVKSGGVLSAPEMVAVSVAQPGIFSLSQTGSGQGAILRQDGVTLAAAGTPAKRGEVMVIFCTGLGAVAPGEAGLSAVRVPVRVLTGEVLATVLFAGLTPGFVGLYQVNAEIAAQAPVGPAVEVVIEAGGVRSRAVTMGIE